MNSFTRPAGDTRNRAVALPRFGARYFRIPQGTIATQAVKDQFVDGTSKQARGVAGFKAKKSGHKFWKEVADTIDRLHTEKENYRTKMSQ